VAFKLAAGTGSAIASPGDSFLGSERRLSNFGSTLKGRYFWNKRSEEGLKKGIEHFQHAIDEDPGYAAALIGLFQLLDFLTVRWLRVRGCIGGEWLSSSQRGQGPPS
jgi:hypothetical protein